jgi:molybdate/tungstate transport system substrate-binding protein
MFDLAEKHYKSPGLAKTLLSHAPDRNIRPNAAELAALLAAGELDYIYDYQSVAESNGFHFIQLPSAIDLGDAKQAAFYATASVAVRGTTPGATATFKGQPILYGATIPAAAPHAKAAKSLYRYLTSPPVVAQLRAAHVDMLDRPIVAGNGAPRAPNGSAERR